MTTDELDRLRRELLAERHRPTPHKHEPRPLTPAEGDWNRLMLAAALGVNDDYKPQDSR